MEAGWKLGQCIALEEEKALSSLMLHMYYTIHIDDRQLLFVASKGQLFVTFRVAEVVRRHGGQPPKSLDSDENFKPEYALFCCE